MSSPLNLSISKVAQLVKNKSIGVTELSAMCFDRITKIQDLNAFITITDNSAKSQLDLPHILEAEPQNYLRGIPIAVKDNYSTKGILTTCASKMLSNYTAPYDATVVRRLYNEGAVIVGKTNLDEFAMGSATVDSFYGPTKNPWRSGLKYDLRRRSKSGSNNSSQTGLSQDQLNKAPLEEGDFFVAGGSSGGSAVAVATGACFGALGSDTGGSTRNPAAFCGVIGLKPSYGLVSRSGLIPLCNSLDVPGILTRTVDDAVILLNSLAGHDHKDSTTVLQKYNPFFIPEEVDIRNMKIGIPEEYKCSGMSSEIIETWDKVADRLSDAGAQVVPVSLPHTQYSIVCYSILCCCDIASNFARFDGIRYGHRAAIESTAEHHYAVTRREALGDVVRERILAGNYFLLKQNYEKYYLQATKVRRLICDDFDSVFQNVDLLLTPVTLTEPVPYSQWLRTDNREHNAIDDFCTQPVNLAGLPAVSVPCFLSSNGLPLSLQLIGKTFKEKEMLTVAKWIEQELDFPFMNIK